MEMKRAVLLCSDCGRERRLRLREEQFQRASGSEGLFLYCPQCGGQKRWRAAGPLDPSAPEPLEETRNILLVDDDDLTLRLLQKVLEAWSTHIATASNGREAIETLASRQFDLAICDVHMPHLSGQEFFDKATEQKLLTRDQIMFITGDRSASVRKFLESTGCIYLYKPIEFLEFSDQVQIMLAG